MLCPYPYHYAQIKHNGRIKPCCRYMPQKLENGITFARHDLNEITLEEVFNGEDFKRLREKLESCESLESIPNCRRCFLDEGIGVQSMRQKPKVNADYKNPTMTSLEISANNICNLRCRSCSADNSTAWFEDEAELCKFPELERSEKPKINALPSIDLTQFKNLKNLKLVGGEPLLNKYLKETLESAFKSSPDCAVQIITNGTIFDDEIVKLLSKFGTTPNICVSIDGYKEVNDYIRHGSVWENLVENLNRWLETGFTVILSTVVSAYSAPRMTELFDWWEKTNNRGLSYGAGFALCQIIHPPYLVVNSLPQHILDSTRDLFKSDSDIYKMLDKPHIDNPRFELFTRELDNMRGEDYESTCFR